MDTFYDRAKWRKLLRYAKNSSKLRKIRYITVENVNVMIYFTLIMKISFPTMCLFHQKAEFNTEFNTKLYDGTKHIATRKSSQLDDHRNSTIIAIRRSSQLDDHRDSTIIATRRLSRLDDYGALAIRVNPPASRHLNALFFCEIL